MVHQMNRVCIVVSSALTVKAFLVEHIRAMQTRYRVDIVLNPDGVHILEDAGLSANVVPLRIERRIAPLPDLRSLIRLVKLFRSRRYDMVHSYTPKAGLLAMLAACIARVPYRVHTFTGQVWATTRGAFRCMLKNADRVIACAATHVLADSESQRAFMMSQCVVKPSKCSVIGAGSVSGVDGSKFRPSVTARRSVREALGIGNDDCVVLFLGRVNRDKGVKDLALAFSRLAVDRKNLRLLIVGPDEDHLMQEVRCICCGLEERVHYIPFVPDPEKYMAAADLFCLPSYREGFGTSIIEAASCGLPAVASRIYGVIDAVEDGESGVLVDAGNVNAIVEQLSRMVDEPSTRKAMGKRARLRAEALFSCQTVTNGLMEYYAAL